MDHREPDREATAAADGDEELARLVRLADPRAMLPPPARARMRAAVHREWRAAVDERRRERARPPWIGAAAAAAAALVVALGVLAVRLDGGAPATTLATVERSTGDVHLVGDAPLVVGSSLAGGTELRTGADGRAALRLHDGAALRLDRGTHLRLVARGVVELERGAVYADRDPAVAAPSGGIEVRTALGRAREVGTQFEVRLDDGTLVVRVREGAARVDHAGGVDTVAAGRALRIDPGGATAWSAVSPVDRSWAWTVDVAPGLELEGRTLDDVLRQLARDRGWTLVYADAELAATARTTTLHGSLAGVPADAVPDVVLGTSDLTHGVDGGTFVVRRRQAERGE